MLFRFWVFPDCTFLDISNMLIIHCAFSQNNVVITGLEGFTSIGHPLYYGE